MQVVIPRTLEGVIKARLGTGKAIFIMGARQVGKTTLLKQMFSNVPDVLWLNRDENDV
jgi:predicted AAA+ superfamily ATPase